MRSILIIGAGLFGLTAALELRRRQWRVHMLETGTVPRPTAASTDVSKVVRADYGGDELYTALGEASITGWHAWNRQWPQPLYHEDGFLVLRRDTMAAGGFEHDSFDLLTRRSFPLRRLDTAAVKETFPAWAAEKYPAGYFNPRAGWAESGKVIARLASEAQSAGVELQTDTGFARLLEDGSRIVGAMTPDGTPLRADCVLVAAGAWTPTLLPPLRDAMWATAQPVLHFKVNDAAQWQAPRFPVWAADISRTGWYGFPALADGTLKIANHGPGKRVAPDAPRVIWPGVETQFREFMSGTFPALADAPLISSHTCHYCDTFDGHFWIDHDPQRPGLAVAAGDSGHAFKFAPMLGGLIADVVERKPNPFASRFAWRQLAASAAAAKDGARAI